MPADLLSQELTVADEFRYQNKTVTGSYTVYVDRSPEIDFEDLSWEGRDIEGDDRYLDGSLESALIEYAFDIADAENEAAYERAADLGMLR